MTDTAWARWRTAESKLAKTGDVELAEKALPERQRWILRATAALESGDRSALNDLGQQAPTAELATICEIALSQPDELDPTRLRASLKRRGVPNSPMPCLDLLRLACVAHNGERATRPQALARAGYSRQVLDAALTVLSTLFKPYRWEESLIKRSPRMASFWAAGIAQHQTDGSVYDYVHRYMPGIEPLAADAWPDLDEADGGCRHLSEATLTEFLGNPLGRPWSVVCTRDAAALSRLGKRNERLETIGAMLDAIDALLRLSAPTTVLPLFESLYSLVNASPTIEKRELLLQQLSLLELRLCWLSPELPAEIAEPVWSGMQDRPPSERIQCARSIVERGGLKGLPRGVRSAVLAFACQSEADWKEVAFLWIATYGRHIDAPIFRAVLDAAPAAKRDRILGSYHAIHGSAVEAIRIGGDMFERGACEDATHIILTCLAHSFEASHRGRQEHRLRSRALMGTVRAVFASVEAPSAELTLGFLGMLDQLQNDSSLPELALVLKSCAHKRLACAPQERHADLLARLQLMTLLRMDDEAQAAFRDFGRWLRKAKLGDAISGALRLCAGMCPTEDIVDVLHEADERNDDPRPGWLRPLTTWLDRHDSATVSRHALSLARTDIALTRGLAIWYEEISDLVISDDWETLLELPGASEEDVDLSGEFMEQLCEHLDLMDFMP